MSTQYPLSTDQLRHIIHYAPLVSIDLIIADPTQRMLVGLRNNEPAKGVYFVPGGIIRKDEYMGDSFRRILMAETGQNATIGNAKFLGVAEHFYPTNRFNDPDFGTHYVVLGFRLQLDCRPDIKLDDQHSDIRWMSAVELLSAEDVHENTKAYFR
jgi:colanic acid biosynthesis protein WcaH